MIRLVTVSLLSLLAAVLGPGSPTACAQESTEDETQPERRQRAAAANAYDRGSEAFLAGDYTDAARWFELANRFMPSAAALRQATRAHLEANNIARAATVALRLRQDYGDDEANAAIADEILGEHASSLARVVVNCDQCSLLLDGAQIDWHDFYIAPETEHTIIAEFNTGERKRTINGKAGQRIDLYLQPPAAPPPAQRSAAGTGQVPVPRDEFEGLSPTFLYVSAGLTAIAGGVLIWSVIDMNQDVETYDDALEAARRSGSQQDLNRAERLLEAGDDKELRTEILIGTTATLAVLTTTFAVLTNWSAMEEAERAKTTPQLHLGARSAYLGVKGRF